MSEFILPPVPEGEGPFASWARQMRRILQTALDALAARPTIERTFAVPIRNLLSAGESCKAPGVSLAGGALSGNFDYAYSFRSSSNGRETPLSAGGNTGVIVSKKVTITGERSLDVAMDTVVLYRKPQGTAASAYQVVGTTDVPDEGAWSIDDEADTSTLGDPGPQVEWPLWIVCGLGWRLRRVKLLWRELREEDASNYWIFWLGLRKNGHEGFTYVGKPQTTEHIGLNPNVVWQIPQANAIAEAPDTDLDYEVDENDRLYLMARAVGTPEPLPEGFAQVLVTKQEG